MNVSWQRITDPLGITTYQFIAKPTNHRKVSGCLWTPENEKRKGTLVAFLHGASGSRFQAPIPYLSRKFSERGIASLAIDGPVHGLRKKLDGGRIALYAEMSKPKAFHQLFNDWKIALELAENKLQYPVQAMAYFGLSMGTFFGIPYLAHRHQERESTAVAVLGLLGPTGVVSPFRKRLLSDAANVQLPLLFFVQREDEMFSREGCLELFNGLASPTKILRENPGKHSAIPTEALDFSCEFVTEHLIGENNSDQNGQ